MKLLQCILPILTSGSLFFLLIGCVGFGSKDCNAVGHNYATLEWTDFIGPNTLATYSYLLEKSEEDAVRSYLVSAKHYPVNKNRSLLITPPCPDAKDVLYYWRFTLEIDGDTWKVCKTRNKWHSHFAISDKVSEVKLHELLEQMLRKQPERIRNPPGSEKGLMWARPLCYDEFQR